MKRLGWLVLVLVAGCGGEEVSKTSVMSGTVLDIDNNPVRDAVVSTRYGSTRTSAAGSFSLTAQANGAVEVTATATRNGVRFVGRSTAFNYKNESTQSVNIVVGDEDEAGTIRGNVRDRDGNALQDASVYAYNGAGASLRSFTDSNGDFEFRDLVGGVTYRVLAGGQGYRSDSTQIALGIRDERTVDFVLDDPGLPNLVPPQNIFGITWVSPSDATRRPNGNPYDAIKKLIDPRYGSRRSTVVSKTRAVDGTLAEVDLQWDEQQFDDLLGYGIYRASSANGILDGYDFLPEPLAAYYVDLGTRTNSTYSYAVTTISAAYPDFPDETESDLSDRVVAETLGRLNLSNPTFNPLTFRWQSGSGAESYSVYLFEEFPGIGVDPVWSSATRVTGFSKVYDGPQLSAGTYYYIVLGWANNDDSRTISQIGTIKL